MLRTLLLTSAAVGLAIVPANAFAAQKKASASSGVALPASNPFAKPSTLPFQAPDFSKIKDSDYLPAILAGMAALVTLLIWVWGDAFVSAVNVPSLRRYLWLIPVGFIGAGT